MRPAAVYVSHDKVGRPPLCRYPAADTPFQMRSGGDRSAHYPRLFRRQQFRRAPHPADPWRGIRNNYRWPVRETGAPVRASKRSRLAAAPARRRSGWLSRFGITPTSGTRRRSPGDDTTGLSAFLRVFVVGGCDCALLNWHRKAVMADKHSASAGTMTTSRWRYIGVLCRLWRIASCNGCPAPRLVFIGFRRPRRRPPTHAAGFG